MGDQQGWNREMDFTGPFSVHSLLLPNRQLALLPLFTFVGLLCTEALLGYFFNLTLHFQECFTIVRNVQALYLGTVSGTSPNRAFKTHKCLKRNCFQ